MLRVGAPVLGRLRRSGPMTSEAVAATAVAVWGELSRHLFLVPNKPALIWGFQGRDGRHRLEAYFSRGHV